MRIFEYGKGILHSKTAVLDRELSLVGSANMDIRSFHLNYEITAMFYAHGVNESLASWFKNDALNSKEVTIAARADLGRLHRGLEALARVSSPIL